MRFWDSSTLVPLLVAEDTSEALEVLFQDEKSVTVWWGTEVECASAVARLERMGSLTPVETNDAFQQLQDLAQVWHLIDPVETIRVSAKRFLRVHEPAEVARALAIPGGPRVLGPTASRRQRRSRWLWAAGTAAVLIGLAAGLTRWTREARQPPAAPQQPSAERMTPVAPRHAVVVLGFENLSGDHPSSVLECSRNKVERGFNFFVPL